MSSPQRSHAIARDLSRMRHATRNRQLNLVLMIVLLSAAALNAAVPLAYAQTTGQIQTFTGEIDDSTRGQWYLLSDLKQGQVLAVRAQGKSGNLDPLVAIVDGAVDPATIAPAFNADVQKAIDAGQDPLAVIPQFANSYFLAWDDDSGGGLDAAAQLAIPADGDYHVLVTRSPLENTFGRFQATLGLDAPEVLTDSVRAKGDPFATEIAVKAAAQAVEEQHITLTSERPTEELDLTTLNEGDTLQVFVESTTPGRIPEVQLMAFGSKAVRGGDYSEDRNQASFEYSFPTGGENYTLQVSACCQDGTDWSADVRLLVGRNSPEVMTGQAEPAGLPMIRQPIPVKVGVKLQQITDVDQKAENYGAVYSLRLAWQDPQLAFRPDECQCEYKVFYNDDFAKYASQQDIDWPSFVLDNQQNNRWVQNKGVVVNPDGSARYFERFTTSLQAPDFHFRTFPFDEQQFYIRVDSIFPVENFTFEVDDEFNEIGTSLGEEEWYITDSQSTVTTGMFSTESETPRFEFRFWAKRHLTFYIFRILVPLGLIIAVSWITFFLQDFGKRVDVTSANLLLFFAYNFTIANDLPRLGYMTYLDALLVGTFIISVLTLAYNVYLKRQESKGRDSRARRIDRYMIWLYPLGFLLAFGIVTWIFFVKV